ncbi:DEAD/DEAH box helicase [Maridesulfovibrio frigidus]|uniref:DEAD/DEAH box helicase n=1 Tax=Maridesulfovibrio frigidus TaxID=340956 RepID=UPI000555C192|nr:DEAD/DEAH box helicase [Maridesulfovibrio frigidus]
MSFDSFGFDSRISSGVRASGQDTPTLIQEKIIPAVLAGRDVLGFTQAGTGKTASFVLPILQKLVKNGVETRGPIRVLVLAPTLDIAQKIHENFISLGKQTGMRSGLACPNETSSAAYKADPAKQVKDISRVSLLTACPAELSYMIGRSEVDLSQVDTLVIDEADRMLEMGFLDNIKTVLAELPFERQNLMFSATLHSGVGTLSSEVLCQPEIFQIANTAPVETVKHICCPVPVHLKQEFLKSLLEDIESESVLIFVRTKRWANRLAARLIKYGFNAAELHGDLAQSKRLRVLDGFKSGKFKIIVSTDLAARSIKCSSITHVINYDIPDTIEIYRHRIKMIDEKSRKGVAFLFTATEDVSKVEKIETQLGGGFSVHHLDKFDYKAPKPLPIVPDEALQKELSKAGRKKKADKLQSLKDK